MVRFTFSLLDRVELSTYSRGYSDERDAAEPFSEPLLDMNRRSLLDMYL